MQQPNMPECVYIWHREGHVLARFVAVYKDSCHQPITDGEKHKPGLLVQKCAATVYHRTSQSVYMPMQHALHTIPSQAIGEANSAYLNQSAVSASVKSTTTIPLLTT